MNVLLVEAIVKGYHECPFTVRTGEAFSLEKKIRVRVSLYAKKRGKLPDLLLFEGVGT